MKFNAKVPKDEHFPYWITDKYIYAILLVFPLFTGFYGYSKITLSKYIFFAAVTGIWALSVIAHCIKKKEKICLEKTPSPVWLVLLYLIFCCVSAAVSPFGSAVLLGEGRFDGLVTIFLCVCIFLLASRFSVPKASYVYALSLSSSINCAVAVLQMAGLNPLRLFPGDYTFYDAGVKFSSVFLGTIGNADLFSAFLCLSLPMVCVFYITAEKRHYALLPTAALSVFCLLACKVSGGILAFSVFILISAPFVVTGEERLRRALDILLISAVSAFAASSIAMSGTTKSFPISISFSIKSTVFLTASMMIVFLRTFVKKKDFEPRLLKAFLSFLSAFVVLAGIVTIYFWKGTEGTVYELSQVMHGNIEDGFGSSRILIWRNLLKLFPERPLLGGGPGTIPLRLNLVFSRYVEETGKTLKTYVDNAHNDYLGILVCTGLLSLVPYLAAQLLSLGKAATADKNPFVPCLACALLCYWVQSFFGLGLFLVSPIMWLLWGMLISSLSGNAEPKPLSLP
ncbi:MAG: O-antigen ligase family protein [Clostridiales bacterium]|nr:O-antigen ligase family protein [Clostridiales bacterium]